MTDKKLKRTEFILRKDFFIKDDAKEQEANPKTQKKEHSKKDHEPETSRQSYYSTLKYVI